jgi:hypothetical protein
MERNKAEIKIVDWEGEQPYSLYDFFIEEDDVIIDKEDGCLVAYDLKDIFIMVQDDVTMLTVQMNLLHAHEHFKTLYKNWYYYKENKRKLRYSLKG